MEQRFYNSTENPNMVCLNCEPGTFLVKECTEHKHSSTCSICPFGMFNKDNNRATKCSYCNEQCPSPSLEVVSECDVKQDIVCSCPSGHFDRNAYVDSTVYPHGTHSVCDPFSACPKGYGFLREGNS